MGATEQLFRIIQSIPSPKAEPFKVWMAQVASSRLEQMQDPEKSIDQAIVDYKRLGYSDAWINQRIKSIEIRKELTDELERTGVQQVLQYASLTDIITREWSGMTTKQYKSFKGLKKESLRDNMTNMEIALNMLAEASATELSKQRVIVVSRHVVNLMKKARGFKNRSFVKDKTLKDVKDRNAQFKKIREIR